MSDYGPGTVAIATVRGVPNVRVMRRRIDGGPSDDWAFATNEGEIRYTCTSRESEVSNVRPVVVIDPEDRDQVKALTDTFMHNLRLREMPDRPAMYAALRSLIAPPKPEEPTGLGAVVEDAEGKKWVRSGRWPDLPWDLCRERDGGFRWSAINAVRVLSAGWSE